MSRSILLSAAMLTTLMTYGCQTTGSPLSLSRQPLSLQQQAALSVNTDYKSALLGKEPLGRADDEGALSSNSDPLTTGTVEDAGTTIAPAPSGNVFGPRIGHYFLADDYVVYRHARPQADAQIEQKTRIELTYFLVSPKGLIQDYASGFSDVSATSCLQIYASRAIICDEPDRLSQDFDRFDRIMVTSEGNGLSVWNVSANAADAQLFDTIVSAEQGSLAQPQ